MSLAVADEVPTEATVSLALHGTGLGAIWGEQKAREMLATAGFARGDIKRIEDDLTDSYEVAAR